MTTLGCNILAAPLWSPEKKELLDEIHNPHGALLKPLIEQNLLMP